MQMEMKHKILTVPALVSIALIAVGMLSGDAAVLGNIIIIAIFAAVLPYFLYRYSRFLWIKSLEEQFPNFIRDMADAIRSGMSFTDAIKLISKNSYGKLSEEVVKMNNRLSWGTPLLRVLDIFTERTKDSKLIKEAMNILEESYNSGGNIASTLDSVTDDILVIKDAEAERNSMVREHVLIMYGVFFMFLAISVMIVMIMVPMINSQPVIETPEGSPISSPFSSSTLFINPCQGFTGFPCALFGSVCTLFDAGTGVGCYYISLFFLVVIIQGIFTGLIAGQLGENSVIAGSKHSMIMVLTALSVFMFLAKLGIFPK